MPKFVIEREIPGAGKLTPEQLQGISQKSCGVLREMGPQIQWVESFVTDDKIYCVYIAPDETAVRKHAEMGGFPANRISQVRTIAAYSYRKSHGLPLIYPKQTYKYTANFLHMLFSMPYEDFEIKPEVVKALDLIFLLHADHEQNCSTSTVRMVASSQANLFASCAAGVCALWGPLHGGANQAVLEMLEEIHRSGDDGSGTPARLSVDENMEFEVSQ